MHETEFYTYTNSLGEIVSFDLKETPNEAKKAAIDEYPAEPGVGSNPFDQWEALKRNGVKIATVKIKLVKMT